MTLSVPIAGALGSARVELSDVINTAIHGALSSGISALGVVFLPQLSFAKGIFRGLVEKKMAPIVFDAGNALLQETHRDALDELADQLQQRQDAVQVCPVVTLADVAALFGDSVKADLLKNQDARLAPRQEEEIMALGYDRAAAVKDRLVHRDGIEPGRIFICAPQAARRADARPRVELRF